ncbi:hypothetical protein ACS0TY_012485 [Phlomoides rotata]
MISFLTFMSHVSCYRIWANRQSAARSKERKMRYIAELERKVQFANKSNFLVCSVNFIAGCKLWLRATLSPSVM